MRILWRVLVLLILLLVFVAGMLFSFQNTVPVPLDLFFVQLPPAALSVWILAAFALGALCGMFGALGLAVRLQTHKLVLNRRLKQAERQSTAAASVGSEQSP